jgi:hypothetical protein
MSKLRGLEGGENDVIIKAEGVKQKVKEGVMKSVNPDAG